MTSAPAWIIALHYFFVIVTLPGVCTAIFRKQRLINRTGHGSLPALYSVAGFLYLLFWWILILPKKTRAN
ncbi:hypothetical protein M3N64_05905 [Sporolactobacillus sp. CPB3-1]|uniref:DUF2306 domain-containing protein n=1 Tax=Sporolactobacillus mangiferae TaxID=2940498 RepID=A0ABT0MA72_9BACL|nr:hypothetical protein [Sporolactobacillus mangiferae]MCL1631483.1 hypothetical protein [Sporolactobacillus mangiferae]